MAMRIISSRITGANVPARVCTTCSSSMSTKSNQSSVPTERKVRNESWRSYLASIFGGTVENADPSKPGFRAQEVDFPHIVEHATGEEKLLLLAFENGFLDPYCNLPVERRGRGTKDNPVLVRSFSNERAIACVCEKTQNYVKYTNLFKGEPKRCQCGHWLELVDAPKFWLKIPKEDLITIPYFQMLELEGKLDKVLAGEEDIDDHQSHGHH